MLTATYTLVALSVEQTGIRVGLQSLRQTLNVHCLQQSALSAVQVACATGAMRRLHDACGWRKLDKFLIPAVRRATRLADELLAEFDALSAQAADALAVSTAFTGAIGDAVQVDAFCGVVATFCDALVTRIEREERELFALARVAVPGEIWFALANQMLAHDAYLQEQRHDSTPASAAAPASASSARQVWRRQRETAGRPGLRVATLH